MNAATVNGGDGEASFGILLSTIILCPLSSAHASAVKILKKELRVAVPAGRG